MCVCLLFGSVPRHGDKRSHPCLLERAGTGPRPLLVASNSCCHRLDFPPRQAFLE